MHVFWIIVSYHYHYFFKCMKCNVCEREASEGSCFGCCSSAFYWLVSGAVQRELISVASPQPTSTHVGHIWEVDKKFCICKWEKMGMKTCAKTLSEILIFFTLTSWDTADVRWPITLCWTLIWCLLFRSDPADPLPTDQQEEVEGLQDPCLHWRQDQQDWSWPPSVCTALSSHSEGPPWGRW